MLAKSNGVLPRGSKGAEPPGGVVVMGGYVQAPPLYSTSPGSALRDGIAHRIVGFKKLRDLLQPKHSYFRGSEGFIKDFSYYQDGEGYLCYPRIKVASGSRKNPYRKAQLRSKHTARTIKKLLALKDSAKLNDFKVAVLFPTFPKEVSEWLCQQAGDSGMCWRLFNRFWNEDYSTLDGDSDGQAAYVNLHKWKTELPTSPHYHFNCIVPNYRLAENGDIRDEDGNNAFEFKKKSWHEQRGGRLVPFSDDTLDELKRRWHSRLVAFARRHGLKGDWMEDYKGIDVFVEYVSWDNDVGKAKLMNKLNYQSRHWLEDYAAYSNKHPDCPEPPGWLASYNNAARTFGWWRHLKSLTVGVDKADKEKLSPIDGEPMEYKGTLSLEGLLYLSGGRVGTLEFYKGKPLFGDLSMSDINWLRTVMWKPP